MTQTQEKSDEKVKSLQRDASKVLEEITDLSAKLREVGKEKIAEVSEETVAMLQKQLKDLEAKASTLNIESKKLLGNLDKSVRSNPYLFILAALGIGLLLGKSIRSQDQN